MRRTVISVLVTVLTAIGLIGLATPAQAIGPTCVATSQITYSPGITLTPSSQSTDYTVSFSGCLTPGRTDIVSGSRSGSFTGVRSCLSVLPPSASGTLVVTWNTGETSTVSYTADGQDVGGQTVHTINGTITAGLFTGSSYTEVITQASLNLLSCLIPPGVQSQSGVGTLTVL